MTATTTTPADVVTLDDPNGLGGASDAALAADVRQALDVWMTHLAGPGGLAVRVSVVDDGRNGLLASGGPTLDRVIGNEDGHALLQSGATCALLDGEHLDPASDITISVNAAYLGEIYLGGGADIPSGEYDGLTLFEHEIAHGLGFGGETSISGSLDATYETAWDHDLARIGGSEVFIGPNAEAVNGGPVNVTTLDNGEGYAHLANAVSDRNANDLMTGLGLPAGMRRAISSIDLAILADVGNPVTGIAGTVAVSGPGREIAARSASGAATSVALGLTLGDTGALTSTVVTLTVTDSLGVLGAGQAGGALVGADAHALTLIGSLADVTAELAGLTYTAATPGSDVVRLSVLDSYGNSGSSSLTMIVEAPVVIAPPRATADAAGPLDAGHVIRFTLAASIALTFSATSGLALRLSDGGAAAYDAADSTPTSLAFAATVAAGQDSPNLVVAGLDLGGAIVTDAHGTPLDPGAVTIPATATGLVIDTTAPAAPTGIGLDAATDSGVAGDGATSAATPVLDGRAEPGGTVSVREGGSLLGTARAGTLGAWSLALGGLAPNASHTLSFAATDAAGNVSATSSCTLVLDSLAPPPPTLASTTSSGSALTSTTLAGTAEAGSLVRLADLVGGRVLALGSATARADGTWRIAAAALGTGGNLVSATATDEAGNVSSPTLLALTIDAAAPASPAAAPDGTPASPAAVAPTTAIAAATAAVPVVTVQDAAPGFVAGPGASIVVSEAAQASVTGAPGASSSMTLFGDAGTLNYANGGGTAIVVGNGAAAMNLAGGAAGSALVAFTGTAATRYTGDAGADEIIAGSGALSVAGGASGSILVFGGGGSLTFAGGSETDTVVGGAGAATVHAGVGGVFGGAGGTLMFANGANTFLAGAVDGDRMSASALGGDMMVAGAGNETLDGALSAAGNLVFGGTGSDQVSLGRGADTFVGGMGGGIVQLGAGNATLYLGTGGANLIVLAPGAAGGADTVSGFRVGTDHLRLAGDATMAATSSATTVSLADGTSIVLAGVSTRTLESLLA